MVKFLDTEEVSELCENLTLPKISRCTVDYATQHADYATGLADKTNFGMHAQFATYVYHFIVVLV